MTTFYYALVRIEAETSDAADHTIQQLENSGNSETTVNIEQVSAISAEREAEIGGPVLYYP